MNNINNEIYHVNNEIYQVKNDANDANDANEMNDNFKKIYDEFKKDLELSYCINCGKKGHNYKKCLYPIISIGIICIKFKKINIYFNQILNYTKKIQNNYLFSIDEISKLQSLKKILSNYDIHQFDNNIEYLMIRRKNSLNYIEFIRGKYDINNIEYLENIINLISIEEKELLLNNNFQDLWNMLWNDNKKKSNEYKESLHKFELLKKGIVVKKNDINININLRDLLKVDFISFNEPEWGFPKGRRNFKEKNIDCAKREFIEETNFKNEDFNILNMSPIEETYLSTNSSKYKHIYYIGQCINNKLELKLDENNLDMITEIGDINWFSIHDALNKIRFYNIDKKTKLIYLHNMIKNTLHNFKNLLNNIL